MMMLTGVQSLMLAVLDQAVSDLQAANASIRWQARAWFYAPFATSHLFSFAQISRELGRDPSILRAQLVVDEKWAVDGPGQPGDASGNGHHNGTGNGNGCSMDAGASPRRRPRATQRKLLQLG
jgi:hypothetical protein